MCVDTLLLAATFLKKARPPYVWPLACVRHMRYYLPVFVDGKLWTAGPHPHYAAQAVALYVWSLEPGS